MSIRLQPAINVFQAVRPASTPALHVVSAQEARVSADNPWGSASASAYQSLHPGLLFGARKTRKMNPGEPELAKASEAAKVVLEKVRFPVIMSPKVDGNRGMIQNGKVVTRGLHDVSNPYVNQMLSRPDLEGFDGEMIGSSPTDPKVLGKTGSLLTSSKDKKGEAPGSLEKRSKSDLKFLVFDVMNEPDKTFGQRQAILKERYAKLPAEVKKYVKLMPQVLVNNQAEATALEKKWVDEEGYEGAILRSPDALYQNSRSSMTDQGFMKWKRFEDEEALLVSCRKLEPTNTVGKTLIRKGVMTKEQMLALTDAQQGVAGFIVKDLKTDVEFKLSAPQMSMEERKFLWKNRAKIVNKVVKYKTFKYGVADGDKPRHGTFLGFRDEADLSPDVAALLVKKLKVKGKKKKIDEAA